jgi:CheY-like chemotaxis protein
MDGPVPLGREERPSRLGGIEHKEDRTVLAIASACCRRRLWLATMRSSLAVWDDEGVPRPTVLIVDDHEAFREAARSLLETEGFDIVGEATGGHDAVAAAERLRPDVVLLDIQLPDLDGFAVADRLAVAASAPDVVLISSREAATYGARLASAPARGFLAKRELSGAALARLLA